MQGSSTMPDNQTSPVWFLKSFINVRFTELARSKHVDIVKFNKKIEELVNRTKKPGNISNSCSKCSKQFSSNSVPTKCSFCLNYYHKSTCLPSHSSTCPARRPGTRAASVAIPTPRPSSSSKPSPVVIANPANLSIIAAPSSASPAAANMSSRRPAVCLASQVNSTNTSSPISSVVSSSPASNISTTANNGTKRPGSPTEQSSTFPHQQISLPVPPDLPPAHPTPPQVCPQTSTTSPSSSTVPVSALNPTANPFNYHQTSSGQNTRKRPKVVQQISPEKAKIDFLNLELNSAKTRMTLLESTIKDRDDTIKIQKEKIRLLEENQHKSVNATHPTNYQDSAPHSTCCSSHSSNPPPSCCLPPSQPPCSRYQHYHDSFRHYHHPHQRQECSRLPSSPDDHGSLLGEMKSHLGNIDDKITSLIDIILEKNLDIANRKPNKKPSNIEEVDDDIRQPDHIQTISVEVINSGESIASDDEFVPEVTSNLPLNSNVQTNQQHLLML